MRVRFCGVRGSTPAPGSDFVRVGGHTSCVAVTTDADEVPRLILDAGTGIRTVTDLLGGAAFHGTILLSHLHWDHVQGLPFFTAGDRDDAAVTVRLPEEGEPAADTLARSMSPPNFPIGPEGLRGSWSFEAIDEGRHTIEDLVVVAGEIAHKGGRTLGYRVADATGSFAYMPDHLPPAHGPGRDAALELADGVDLLIHDAQFFTDEATVAAEFGHARVDQAISLAAEAGVGRLVLFHHAPDRVDDVLDGLIDSLVPSLPVGMMPPLLAREGFTIDVAASDRASVA